jgi:hypothetical protein
VRAFPDLEADVRWVVAEGDMVVVFHGVRGSQQGPWLFVQEPTSRRVETSFVLGFRFDDNGRPRSIAQCSPCSQRRCARSAGSSRTEGLSSACDPNSRNRPPWPHQW